VSVTDPPPNPELNHIRRSHSLLAAPGRDQNESARQRPVSIRPPPRPDGPRDGDGVDARRRAEHALLRDEFAGRAGGPGQVLCAGWETAAQG
jgi:hypothetical protein